MAGPLVPRSPPHGSAIAVSEAAERLELTWRPPPVSKWRRVYRGVLGFWLLGWAVGEIFAIYALASGQMGLSWLAWLAVWTLVGLLVIQKLRQLRRPACERLVLERDTFNHFAGEPPPIFFDATVRDWFIMPPPPPHSILRDRLPPMRLDRVDGRQRLTYDDGADRIEIGTTLREPEREWLADVIEAWRSGGGHYR